MRGDRMKDLALAAVFQVPPAPTHRDPLLTGISIVGQIHLVKRLWFSFNRHRRTRTHKVNGIV